MLLTIRREGPSPQKDGRPVRRECKKDGKGITIGPFSAHDRRIIHIALKEDPSLKTESLGEGEWKKIKIIPTRQEGEDYLTP